MFKKTMLVWDSHLYWLIHQQHPTTALVSRLPTTLCQGKFEDDNANILQCDGLLWRMRQEEGWECSVREGKERLSWVAIEISMQAHTRKAMDYAQRDQSLNILSWEIARFRAGGSCSEKEAIQHNTAAAVSIMSVLPCTSRNSVSCRFSLGTRHQILYFLTAYNSLLSHKRRKNRMNSALESAHTGNICTQNPKANQPHCSTHCHHNGLELQHDNSMSFFGLQYVNFQTAFFDAFPVEHVLACVADSLLPLLRFSNKNSVTFEIRYWARKLLLIPEILWAKRINDIIIDRELRIKELNWFSTVGGGLSQLAQQQGNSRAALRARDAGLYAFKMMKVASSLGDNETVTRCALYVIISLSQQGYEKLSLLTLRAVRKWVQQYGITLKSYKLYPIYIQAKAEIKRKHR